MRSLRRPSAVQRGSILALGALALPLGCQLVAGLDNPLQGPADAGVRDVAQEQVAHADVRQTPDVEHRDVRDGGSTLDANDGAKDVAAKEASMADVTASDTGPPPCAAPVSLVQYNYGSTPTTMADNWSVLMPGAVTAGDYILVGTNYDPSCGIVASVGDTSGDVYTRVIGTDGDPDGGAGLLETWGASGVAAAGVGSNTVTVTYTISCMGKNVKVLELGGVNPTTPIDGTAFMHGPSGTVPTATLEARVDDMLIAHTADETSALGAGPGWSLLFTDAWATIAEDRVVMTAGTQLATYQPGVGDGWGIQAVAVRCK